MRSTALNFFITFLLSYGYAQIPESMEILVVDSVTDISIAEAWVFLDEKDSCRTGGNGTCIFDSLSPGTHLVTIKALGFQAVTRSIEIQSREENNYVIRLNREAVQQLDKMVVIGYETSDSTASPINSFTRLDSFELTNTPGTANDINRVLASHPAVVGATGNEFDNAIYVRGGASFENMYLIDGIEMEDANHFSLLDFSGGKIGFINSSLVKHLDFYFGAFPSAHPSRLSSVMEINLRNGSMTKPGLSADLNVSGIGITAETPMGKKASVLANLRFTDATLLEDFLTEFGVPRYGDAILKTVVAPDENNLFRFTAVGAYDNYKDYYDPENYRGSGHIYKLWIHQAGAIAAWEYDNGAFENEISISGVFRDLQEGEFLDNYQDTIVINSDFRNISLNHRIKSGLGYAVMEFDTIYEYKRFIASDTVSTNGDKRAHILLKNDFALSLRQDDQFKFGFSAGNFRYTSEIIRKFTSSSSYFVHSGDSLIAVPHLSETSLPLDIDSTIDLRRFSGYAEYVLQKGKLKAVAGIRGEYFTLIDDYGFSPRLGLQLNIPRIGTFSQSCGLYYQLPPQFNTLIERLIFSNRHTLSDIDLQRCWQTVFGYHRALPAGHALKLESYFKWYDRDFLFSYPIEKHFRTVLEESRHQAHYPKGKKRAYGIELSFQRSSYRHLYYSLCGSVFHVENEYTDDKWYNDKNNVRATVGFDAGWAGNHHGIALRLSATGGRPYTPTEKRVYSHSPKIFEVPSQNYYSRFLEPVLIVNLRYSFKATPRWGSIGGYIDILNLFNHVSVVESFLDPYWDWVEIKNNGIVPVIGIEAAF